MDPASQNQTPRQDEGQNNIPNLNEYQNTSTASPVSSVGQSGVAPKKKSLFWPIFLMVWPAVGLILAIALYAITNILTASPAPASGSGDAALFNDSPTSTIRTVVNVILFFFGAASVALGPVSFIVGVVLLVIAKKSRKS